MLPFFIIGVGDDDLELLLLFDFCCFELLFELLFAFRTCPGDAGAVGFLFELINSGNDEIFLDVAFDLLWLVVVTSSPIDLSFCLIFSHITRFLSIAGIYFYIVEN